MPHPLDFSYLHRVIGQIDKDWKVGGPYTFFSSGTIFHSLPMEFTVKNEDYLMKPFFNVNFPSSTPIAAM